MSEPQNQPPPNPPAPDPSPPPAPAPAQPAAPAAPVPASGASSAGNVFHAENAFRQLYDAVNSLPEKLVNAAREAAPPAPVVNPPDPSQTNSRKTFGEWWFTK